MEINRISVLGISGSGKSYFSRELAKKYNLPIVHMDNLFWKENWTAVPEEIYLQKHSEIIKQDKWLIEGYIDATMVERLEKSDLVIFLDYNRFICCFRVLKRFFQHRKVGRSEFGGVDMKERFPCTLLKTVFLLQERKCIEDSFKIFKPKNLIILKNPDAVAKFLQN